MIINNNPVAPVRPVEPVAPEGPVGYELFPQLRKNLYDGCENGVGQNPLA